MKNNLDIIIERFNLANCRIVSYNPKMRPIVIEECECGSTEIEHLYLLDENGGKIKRLLEDETVGLALHSLQQEDMKAAMFVLSLEAETLAAIPENA